MIQFKGLGVAIVTPFTRNGEIDFVALEKLIEHQISGNTDYIVVLGTTGETATLSKEEKNSVVRFVVEKVNRRIPVVVGMGGNNTRSLVNEILNFNFEGVSGILSVTPYYNKPTQKGLIEHYRSVAEAAPLPVILYNVPGRTGVNLEPATLKTLRDLSPKFVAVKEASGNMQQIAQIAADTSGDFLLISGDDSLTLPMISLGAAGVISVAANAWPQQFSRLVHEALEGQWEQAKQINDRFLTLIKFLFQEGNPGGIKAALHALGIVENSLRLPLVPVSEQLYSSIKEEMSRV